MGFRNDQLPAPFFQGQQDLAVLAAATCTSTGFTASGYPTGTITATQTKTYLLEVFLSFFCSILGAGGQLSFQVRVDTIAPAGQPTKHTTFNINEINTRYPVSFCIPLQLSPGSHTFSLDWKTVAGSTFNINTFDFVCYMLIG